MPTAIHTVTHQLGSVLLNAVDDLGNRWWASTIEDGSSTPPPKLRATNRPYGHGGYRARSYWGPKRFTIEGAVECTNGLAAEVAADLIRGLFSSGDPISYARKSRLGTRLLQVELSDRLGVDVLPGGYTVKFQIPLKANDPRYLDSVVQTSQATVGAASTSGLDWANGGLDWANGGLDWGVDASSGILLMANTGNADAYPSITITGPITNPSITDPATGRVVAYTGLVDVGQTLTIDMSPFTRAVTLNGIDRISALSSAQWITIPPSTTRLLQFAGSGAGTATATLRSAWV
jgi:hypothetical protein